MNDLNSVSLSGRLVDDASLMVLGNGTPSANFRIATQRYAGKDESGKAQFRTLFLDVQWPDRRAQPMAEWLTKGKWVIVCGGLDSYQTDSMKAQGRPPVIILQATDVMFGPKSNH